jgi:hypothetical protein
MENSCQKNQELILELIEGTLPAEKRGELERHIYECAACKEYLQGLEADDKLLGDFTEAMQPRLGQLEEKVVDALGHEVLNKTVSPDSVWQRIIKSPMGKLAAAAILLIFAGYAVGRLTAPRAVDVEELRYSLESSLKSSIEPAIHQKLLEQMRQDWRLAFASGYVRLKDELNQQFRDDLNEFAIQTLTASSVVTNQLLTELIESIDAAQAQERHWVAAALGQIELNRLEDNSQLRNDLATFAVQTTSELQRTKKDVAKWITYGRVNNFVPDESKSLTPSNERSKQ